LRKKKKFSKRKPEKPISFAEKIVEHLAKHKPAIIFDGRLVAYRLRA
jgi:hypothetical protein